MGEIAGQAGVARSTLHRYFPERGDLLIAVSTYASGQVQQIAELAHNSEGAAVDIVLHLALEHFERWNAVMWVYLQHEGDVPPAEPDAVDRELSIIFERGYADGSIDNSLPVGWMQHALYATVYSAWEYERNGHAHSEAAMMLMSTMRKILAPMSTLPA